MPSRSDKSADHPSIRRSNNGKGWRPDTPDARDHVFSAKLAARAKGVKAVVTPPAAVDLRDSGFLPVAYDQGDLGSCTANAIGGAYEYEQKRQGLVDYMPSRLFIYYGERDIEGTIKSDAGAEIRDGMKVASKLGVPHEKLWPYKPTKFASKPLQAAYDDAAKHQCLTYARVDVTPIGVKRALAVATPVVLGFSVYESFEEVGANGLCPIPNAKKEKMLGGHAVLCIGYRKMKGANGKAADHAIIRNSWGPSWADGGYCYMPLNWLANTTNADDFWAIQSVEGGPAAKAPKK